MGDGSLSLRRSGLETGPTVQDPARPVERCEVEREGCEVTEEPTSGAADCREGFWEVGGPAFRRELGTARDCQQVESTTQDAAPRVGGLVLDTRGEKPFALTVRTPGVPICFTSNSWVLLDASLASSVPQSTHPRGARPVTLSKNLT